MKITFVVVGKTTEDYLQKGIKIYENRMKHYLPFEYIEIKDLKNTRNLSELQVKEKEGELIEKVFQPGDHIVLLDENGKQYTSVQFSDKIAEFMVRGLKRLVFVVGGPYGFSDKLYQIANEKLSLSKMTFSHQMVRLFFVEQIYRAMTIQRGEPYHHE